VFVINGAHECRRGRKDFINKDENSLFRGKFDPFANDIAELSDCQVGGNEVLFLIDRRDIGLFNLLADNLE